ncbi:MAG: SIR2 family protein [Thermodesulfobacteriota bacterium]|nr:SIR2 family protein [Thermodesulfobacteriota bacterium]
MAKNLLVVFGSGASYDSGYKVNVGGAKINPPIDKKFFGEINDNLLKGKYYALWKFTDLYFSNSHNHRLEDVWTAVDLNHKHIRLGTYKWTKENADYLIGEYFTYGEKYLQMDMISPHSYYPGSGGGEINYPSYNAYKFLGDCGRDFRQLIYDIYSSYHAPDLEDNFKSLHSKINESEFCKLIAFITFNYDCYLENALNPNFKYIKTNDNVEEIDLLLHGETPIIKLHGSLNWEENSILRSIIFHSPPYEKARQVKPTYENDGYWLQPAIIPPTIFKQEINDDARADDILTQTILQQWRAAIRVLIDAEKIMIIGYSFPPADYHSRRIFQIARMRRKMEHKPPFEILYCGGTEDRTDTLLNIFGQDCLIIN